MKLLSYICLVVGVLLLSVCLIAPECFEFLITATTVFTIGSVAFTIGVSGILGIELIKKPTRGILPGPFCWLIANMLVALVAVPCYFIFLS